MKLVQFDRFRVFDWLIIRCTAPTGTIYYYQIPNRILRGEKPTATYYTRGKIEAVLNDTIACDDRVPGFFSGDLPGYEAGTLKMTVVEDAEWWCLDSTVIKAALPPIVAVNLSANEVRAFPSGSKIFLAAGIVEIDSTTYHGPCAIEVSTNEINLKALVDAYCLTFLEQ
jgi:hypothetical protein